MRDDVLDRLAELNQPYAAWAFRKSLDIGSDVEIAGRVGEDLYRAYGDIVGAEGQLWRYGRTHWEPILESELRRAVHAYDGAEFKTPTGEPSCVKLGKGRIDSVLHELAVIQAQPAFFETVAVGINCASGFIRFDQDGTPSLEPHSPEHRCRHTLPGRWSMESSAAPPEGSLLYRLLEGVFRGDKDAGDKIDLLAEVAGSAALGYATRLRQPRAVVLKGETAENGKSQILDVIRGLLPPSATCTVPAERMGDERHIPALAGKLLNASDELSGAAAIASNVFKAIITGEAVQGREVYKTRIEFRPVAQHLFATNTLPGFEGGMDRGVQRRLLVIPFTRVIPLGERVEGIGRRIPVEEADQLLAWAVDGASRLIRQHDFGIPASSKEALNEWIYGADPVLAWLNECVDTQPYNGHGPQVRTSEAHRCFESWARSEGWDRLPPINGFVQRVKANKPGVEYRRSSEGAWFLGMVIRSGPE